MKKPGPSKIAPELFHPALWVPKEGTIPAFLVCENRTYQSRTTPPALLPKGARRQGNFWFPVAIQLTPNFREWGTITDLRIEEGEWRALGWGTPGNLPLGIAKRAACIALAEAWKIVDPSRSSVHPITRAAHFSYRPAPAHSQIVRMLLALWWERLGETHGDKARKLSEIGVDCSENQVKGFAGAYGL